MRNRYRLGGLLVAMTVLFGALAAKLVLIQGVSAGRYLAVGRSQRISSVTVPGERGAIFDRNGQELAISIPQTTIWANPHLVTDPRQEASVLGPVLGIDSKVLQLKLSANAQFVYLARKVDDATAAKVKDLKEDGIFSLEESKRFLPDGALAASLIGAVGTDNTGLSGLEQQYDKTLSGRAGKLIEERDPAGSQIPGGLHEYQPAARGQDVVLTIDQSLQYDTEQALSAEIVAAKAKGGIAMLMDSRTGELLAVADLTTPPTAPTPPGAAPPPAPTPVPAASATAFTNVYEPGSVNKLVTVSAALQLGEVKPNDRFAVPNSLPVADAVFRDAEAHPVEHWTTTDILANSSNVGTIGIAQRLGKAHIDQYLRAFGFGQTSSVHFPGESAGILLDPAKWSATSVATVSIGQGVAVTAVQMLAAYNTIANNGTYVAPKLIAATVDDRGRQHPSAPSARRQVVSAEVARDMTAMLGQVVKVGTGMEAAIGGYSVAGKTGTARIPLDGARGYKDGVYASSFAGFVPAEQPALTGIVILDETTQFGGTVAAPVFASIARYGLQEFRVPPPAPVPLPPGVPEATPATAQGAGEKLPSFPTPTTVGVKPTTPATTARTLPSVGRPPAATTSVPSRTTTTTGAPSHSPPATAGTTTTPTTRPLKR